MLLEEAERKIAQHQKTYEMSVKNTLDELKDSMRDLMKEKNCI